MTELRLMVDRWTVLAAPPVRFGECDQPSAKSGSKKSCNYLKLELESLSFTGSANWKLIYAARAQLYPLLVGFRVLILPSFTQETPGLSAFCVVVVESNISRIYLADEFPVPRAERFPGPGSLVRKIRREIH